MIGKTAFFTPSYELPDLVTVKIISSNMNMISVITKGKISRVTLFLYEYAETSLTWTKSVPIKVRLWNYDQQHGGHHHSSQSQWL